MTRSELRQILVGCCNDVFFIHNGKTSGITVQVDDYIPTYQVWHGDAVKEYGDVDELMDDPFYSGESINSLIGKVEFSFS